MKKFFILSFIITGFMIGTMDQTIYGMNESNATLLEVDRLQKIKEKGGLTLLSSDDEPHSYRDPKTGVYRGIDADIIKEVAKRLGINEVRVRFLPFDNLMNTFKNSEFDLIGQGVAITEERKNLVDFTIPVYTDEDGILTRKDSGINSKDDLKNSTIGTVGGTIFFYC